jgi:predicted negative regulator of RcsB-dependent stress response
MLDKAKEFLQNEKKYIIIAIVLLVVGIVAWDVFSKPNGSAEIGEVRSNLQSVGDEQQRTADAIAESKRLAEQLRQANIRIEQASNNIQQSNNSIRSTVDQSEQLNKSSADLIADGKRIVKQLREENK